MQISYAHHGGNDKQHDDEDADSEDGDAGGDHGAVVVSGVIQPTSAVPCVDVDSHVLRGSGAYVTENHRRQS